MSVDQEDPSIIDHGGLCRIWMSPDGTIEAAQFYTMRAVRTGGEGYELKRRTFTSENEAYETLRQHPNPSGILDEIREAIFEPNPRRAKELIVSPRTAARMAIEGAFTKDNLERVVVDSCHEIIKILDVWFDEGESSACVDVVVSCHRKGDSSFQVR